ncbi:MAG: UvrD-helicase domain-containing protein [Rhodoferax sp.]
MAWEDRLKADKGIDFEDMLNLAGDCVEDGRWTKSYELVLVDEFQNASQARVQLVAGLVKAQGNACLRLAMIGKASTALQRLTSP